MDYIAELCGPPFFTAMFSAIAGALIGALCTRYRAVKKEERRKIEQNDLMIEGMKWLLHIPLESQCDYWISLGYIEIEAINNIEAQYAIYQGLGGNGDIERRMKVIRKLKVIKKKTEGKK